MADVGYADDGDDGTQCVRGDVSAGTGENADALLREHGEKRVVMNKEVLQFENLQHLAVTHKPV